MAETIRLKISPAVARFVQPGCGREERLSGIGDVSSLGAGDQVLLAFCLARDADQVVRAAAVACFSSLPDRVLQEYLSSPDVHPSILDLIVRVHHTRPGFDELLAHHPALSPGAASYLRQVMECRQPASGPAGDSCQDGEGADDAPCHAEEQDDAEEEPGEVDEKGEEFLSKYKLAQVMGIAEKIKMALSGDKEWRSILVKDSNKLVSSSVIKNPRITESEIMSLLKAGVQHDELIRLICANKEWVKSYKIRKALVDNPRTPVQNSLRYLQSLTDKDVAGYAKSKNVSSVISTQAKRILLNKKK